MVDIPRLFAGELTPGDFRARISKPDRDASDPNLGREHLDFDTAWPFAGNIHFLARERIYPINANQNAGSGNTSPRTLYFPALPYVPCVKIFLSAPDGTLIYWRNPEGEGGLKGGPGSLTYEAYSDRVVIYAAAGEFRTGVYVCALVFKIPARDLGIVGNDPRPLARLMMGKRGSEYGLYASRPGFDVRTCAKSQMTFSSDDDFTVINKTFSPTSSQKGAASSPTDNVTTDINFTYTWKGYYPIIFFFGTFNTSLSDQVYTLPSDKKVNTWGGAYPMSGYVRSVSPGAGQVQIRRWGSEAWGNVSIIVFDRALPTD